MKIGGIVAAASVCAWCSLSAATCPEGVAEDPVRNAEVKFGIRLGERLPEKVVKTTVSPCSSFGRRRLLQNSSSYFHHERRQPLTPPFFGVLFADVSCDYDGRVMSISIDDSFRRGLDRNESLAKINALRDEVSRRVGFDLVEYRFATSSSGTGVTKSDGGESVWLDMDTAFAVSVTTNGDFEVSVSCSVNPPSNRSFSSKTVVVKDEDADSKVAFAVKVVKRSVMDAELKHRQEEAAREERRRKLKLSEFYGVRFGQSVSTNGLVRFESEGTTFSGAETNHYVQACWLKSDPSMRPRSFFDFAHMRYSFDTVTPTSVSFVGHFPTNVSKKASVEMLDDLARELSERYGFELSRNVEPDADDDAVPTITGDSEPEECDVSFYAGMWRKQYYHGGFGNNQVAIDLSAGVNSRGVLCVKLMVEDLDAFWRCVDEGIIREW